MRDKTSGEFMVAVFALVRESLLQPSGQVLPLATLRLRETLRGLTQFVRMRNLLAGGQREEMQKAWIKTNVPCAQRRNTVRLCVDAQAQIPARGTLDETTALELAGRDVLLVKAHRPDAWHMDARPHWRFERIRKGNAGQPVTPSFELGLLGQLLITPLPGNMGRIQYALQRVAGNAELFPMIGKQVMKRLLTVIDTVFRILFDLAYGPIPDTCQMPKPRIKLVCLRVIESELELTLDHATPVSGFRCIAEPLRVEHHQR